MAEPSNPSGSHGMQKGTRVALLVTSLASFLTPFMLSATNVALPSIGEEFGMDPIALGWIQTSYLLSSAIVLVPIGRIADIRGRKAIFLLGTAIFAISCFVMPFSTSSYMLIAVRLVQGVGGAMIFGTSVAILTSVFPPGETGKALGINVATVYSAIALGPFLGGILTSNLGWRSIFFFSAVAGIVVFIMTVAFLKGEWAEAKGRKFDAVGSILYAISLASIMVGALALSGNIAAFPFGTPIQALIFIGGGFLLFIFALWELRSPSPVLDIRLFKNNRVFTLSNLAALISYAATYAVSFFLSLYLQTVKGLPPEVAGTVLLAQPIVQAAISPAAGWLSDRASPRIVASLGIGIDAIGLFLLSATNVETDLWFIIIDLVVLGAGFALFSSPNTNAIMTSVERQHYGTSSALVSTMRQLGQVLSMTIAMIIISTFIAGQVPPGEDSFVKGMQVAFLIFGALCIVGMIASAARGKGNMTVKPGK
jgi:EmrB/QacA subfamily drug resistance transporter